MPLTALQMPIALARSRLSVNTLVMIASVAGKIAAAPMPISARAPISAPGGPPIRRTPRSRPNSARPTIERAPPAEAVAEPAGREQRAGEDEEVGVDDPLQLPGRRSELVGQARQRDVDDQAIQRRHEHGEAHTPSTSHRFGFGPSCAMANAGRS